MTNTPEPPGAETEARFVAAMKRLREESEWSQGEMARRMTELGWKGFHQTTISRIEKGERPVRLGEAQGIAAALNVTVDQMIHAGEDNFTGGADLERAAAAVRGLYRLQGEFNTRVQTMTWLVDEARRALSGRDRAEVADDRHPLTPVVQMVHARAVRYMDHPEPASLRPLNEVLDLGEGDATDGEG
ncbi:XRE family transcriptional regulator [Micrococcus aloeverae]|nr:XRE family transcriptional regulator [Micrococcus aloeverae]